MGNLQESRPPRPAAVTISVALCAAYWLTVVVGLTVQDWVRHWPGRIKEPLYLAGWTMLTAALLTAVWRGRPRPIYYLSVIARVTGAVLVLGGAALYLFLIQAQLADAGDLVDAVPGFLGGGVLLTAGYLLRRRRSPPGQRPGTADPGWI